MHQQFPPYAVLNDPHAEQEPRKKGGKKAILTCWLILPFLLFLLGLIFFIILVSRYYPTDSKIDHAISVTKQLGADVQANLWEGITPSKVACVDANSAPLIADGYPFATFQGLDTGFITQIVRNQEYSEDEEKGAESKVEKGIPFKNLKKMVSIGNDKYHLCVKTFDLNSYIVKPTGNCPAEYRQTCASSKICVKTGQQCPFTKLKITSPNHNFFWQTKKVEGDITGAHKQFVIGTRGGFTLPCKNPDYLGEKPSKTDYPMYGIQHSGCDEYGTYTKTQAEALYADINYPTLLHDNDIDNGHYESPYFYDYIANKDKEVYKIYVIHRPKIVEDAKCMLSNKGFAKLPTVRLYAGEANRPLYVYFIMGLVLSAIGLLFWIILLALAKQKKRESNQSTQLFKVVHLIALVLAILEIILFIHYMSEFKGKKDDMITVKDSFKAAKDISCYAEAEDWNTAFEKVYDFVYNAIAIDYPFIISLFCFGAVYVVLMLIVYAAIKAKKLSPFSAPYSKK